jgi:hypothetical protein
MNPLTAFLTEHFLKTFGLERTAKRIQHFPYHAPRGQHNGFARVRCFRKTNCKRTHARVMLDQPYGYNEHDKPEPHWIFSLEHTLDGAKRPRPITRPLFSMWLPKAPALHNDGYELFLYAEDWNVFRRLYGAAVHARFAPRVIVDLRGWHPEPAAEMRALGWPREHVNRLEYATARGFSYE